MSQPASPRPQKSTTVRAQLSLAMARTRLRLAGFVLADGGAATATRLFATPRRFPRPPREHEVLATAERFTVETQPVTDDEPITIPAWRWGRGPTVLLVHGWEGRGAQLGDLVAPLVAAGLSVVTFDAPAHGDAAGHRLYLTDMANAILAVAAAVGPLHGVVAHSFGAIATSLALRRGLVAAHLAYIAPASLVTSALARFAAILQLPRETVTTMEHELERINGFSPSSITPERLARPETPLLVVHGEADDEVPIAESRRLTAAWRGSTFLALPDLGHRRILRAPLALGPVVRHLTAALPAPSLAAEPTSHRRPDIDAWVDPIRSDQILR